MKPTCKQCGSPYHTKMSCKDNPAAVAKAAASRKRMQDKQRLKASTKPVGASKVKKVKTTPRSKAKDKAWKAFSDYIRLRDSLLTTGTPDNCICVTCSVRGDTSWKPYKAIQAGHAVGGRGNAVLFHEELANGQCGYCNRKPPMGLGGDYGNYAIFLIEKYGIEHTRELQKLRHSTDVKYKTHDFIEIEQRYKQKRADLIA